MLFKPTPGLLLHRQADLLGRALPVNIDPQQVNLIVQVVEAEVHDLHSKYVARREHLQEISDRDASPVLTLANRR